MNLLQDTMKRDLNLTNNKKLNQRYIAWNIIIEADKYNQRVSDISRQYLNNVSLSSQQKNFITYLVNGTIRMKGTLDWEINKVTKLNKPIKILLRISLYQIRYMDSVPNFAAVNTAVELSKNINDKYVSFTNAVLRKLIKSKFEKPLFTNISEYSNYSSHPEWLIKKWLKFMKKNEISDLIKWNNSNPKIWFRINTNVTNNKKILNNFKNNNINFSFYKYDNNFFTIDNPSKLINSKYFRDGQVTVQNPSAGLVCYLLDPKENDFIIDCCSAPGGKTSYISQLMNNKGKILSIDNDNKRINLLKDNIKRLNVKNVTVQNKNLTKDILPKTSKILIDMPCSGTGVINKKVDIKWRRSFSNIIEMQSLQKEILNNVSKYLNKNGIIVYSTCSIEKEENMDVINSFLDLNNNFSINKLIDILPKTYITNGVFKPYSPLHKIDGGFACILKKND